MASLDSIFVMDTVNPVTLTVDATTCSAVQTTGPYTLFGIIGTGDFHIKFGDSSSMADASATTGIRMPGNSFCRFDMGQHTNFKVYNPGGSAITIQWIHLTRS